ncbi:hypothetical protein BMS3Abin03_02069 [bacterium BMS3Abin03]|nr:hypothetical protein BMS3Abin03_02069 [bacterium BMS3Abin03]
MNKYISMLRGINVSGQKKIKMDDLRSLYEELDFENVVTYIQSGNVVFDSKIKNTASLKLKIEAAIDEKYKFFVNVIIRTADEWQKVINNNLFGHIDLENESKKYLVTFLSAVPSAKSISELRQYVTKPDKLVVHNKEVYLYIPNGYGKSKLSNTFIERKLGVEATTRNWKTVVKLYGLSR